MSDAVHLILGDQLDSNSLIFKDISYSNRIVMAEVLAESISKQRPSSRQRSVLFLTAMREFSKQLIEDGHQVEYFNIRQAIESFSEALTIAHKKQVFNQLKVVLPGDEQVRLELKNWCNQNRVQLVLLEDQHFLTRPGEFQNWMQGKTQPRMEYWYRHLRKTRNILIQSNGKPVGGKWNYDQDNRRPFSKSGPQNIIEPPLTNNLQHPTVKQVIEDINQYLPNLNGNLKSFPWPINRTQAQKQLAHFIDFKLANFGDNQDAMWQEQPFLFHSLLSSSLNLKLLHPQEVIDAALAAYANEKAPLNSVEGFIRQVIGWREYIRGLYWLQKSNWQNINFLQASHDLPSFYWNGATEMNCLSQSIKQVIDYGYGHHIQRLMVTGLFALLYGVKPQQIEAWYLSMFVDAVAWVEQPNTLAMSQYADGGFLASKPYIASGNYINRMSNYCKHCKYKYNLASGESACPFTTLYWDFVKRHQQHLEQNPRLSMQVKNWLNKPKEEQTKILQRAEYLRTQLMNQPDEKTCSI